MKRILSLFTLSALVFVAAVSVASAGGWAVVTLDAIPTGVVVNTPVTVGMMVRQHGKTPMTTANVNIRASQSTGEKATKEKFEVRARHDGKGHYTADLTFGAAGKWDWQVSTGLYPEWQSMPTVEVANSVEDEVLLAKANTNSENAAPTPNLQTMAPSMLLLGVGVLGFVLSAGGLVYWFRARRVG